MTTPSTGGIRFLTRKTTWGRVVSADTPGSLAVERAHLALARRFWRPIMAYVKAVRPGRPIEAAQITERFNHRLTRTDPGRITGDNRRRYRTFVKSELDAAAADDFKSLEQVPNKTTSNVLRMAEGAHDDLLPCTYRPGEKPGTIFDCEWARTIGEIAVRLLRTNLQATGRQGSWTMLQKYDFNRATGGQPKLPDLAKELRGSEMGLRIALAYARTMWRRLMLDMIVHTVENVGEVMPEVERLQSRLPEEGDPWELLRSVLASDDDFLLLHLYLEKARLRSDELKGFADILELPGDRIGETMIQRGILTSERLWELLKEKEDHLAEVLEGLSISGPREDDEDLPPEVTEALQDARNTVGKFVKVKFLGKGSTGNVWKCWDTRRNDWVALKLLENLPMTRRLLREAQISFKLDHPNIVRVRDLGMGDAEGGYYAVLDFVEGRTLGGEALPVDEALRVSYEVAMAVDYAHQQGVIHRDLKPQNVMVDTSGKVVVLDFGIARQSSVDSSGKGGVVLGTPQYMAPEQATRRVEDPDITCDIYGVGAILYELLTGRAPYQGPNPVMIIAKLVREEPPTIREVNPDLPEDLERIVGRAMAREPGKRYPSCRALAKDIQVLLHTLPIEEPATPAEKAETREPSYLLPGLLWTLFALGALGGLVYWFLRETGMA